MRSRLEIETELEMYRRRFSEVDASVDPETSVRLYVIYRGLYWVLHPEIKEWDTLIKQVNMNLGLERDVRNGQHNSNRHINVSHPMAMGTLRQMASCSGICYCRYGDRRHGSRYPIQLAND